MSNESEGNQGSQQKKNKRKQTKKRSTVSTRDTSKLNPNPSASQKNQDEDDIVEEEEIHGISKLSKAVKDFSAAQSALKPSWQKEMENVMGKVLAQQVEAGLASQQAAQEGQSRPGPEKDMDVFERIGLQLAANEGTPNAIAHLADTVLGFMDKHLTTEQIQESYGQIAGEGQQGMTAQQLNELYQQAEQQAMEEQHQQGEQIHPAQNMEPQQDPAKEQPVNPGEEFNEEPVSQEFAEQEQPVDESPQEHQSPEEPSEGQIDILDVDVDDEEECFRVCKELGEPVTDPVAAQHLIAALQREEMRARGMDPDESQVNTSPSGESNKEDVNEQLEDYVEFLEEELRAKEEEFEQREKQLRDQMDKKSGINPTPKTFNDEDE